MKSKTKNIIVICFFAVFVFGLFVLQLVLPDNEISDVERRPLKKMPEISISAIANGSFMQDFESYSMDQFPMRDYFRTAKAVCSNYLFMQKDKDGLYYKDGYIAKLDYPVDDKSLDNASLKFRALYDKYLAGNSNNIYLCVVPDKGCFIADKYNYPSVDFNEFAAEFRSRNSYMNYIDIYDCLDISDYYRTDTHWRQEKIVDVAEKLKSEMGSASSVRYEQRTADSDFYGVYYGQLALPVKSEDLNYLDNDIISSCTVYDYETDEMTDVYNMDMLDGKDPYEMFLSGSKAILSVKNPNADNSKRLIIFRDSFASSIAPLLIDAYSEIVLIDIRYISSEMLGNFIDFKDSDVLFLYSSLVLNNSITLK